MDELGYTIFVGFISLAVGYGVGRMSTVYRAKNISFNAVRNMRQEAHWQFVNTDAKGSPFFVLHDAGAPAEARILAAKAQTLDEVYRALEGAHWKL